LYGLGSTSKYANRNKTAFVITAIYCSVATTTLVRQWCACFKTDGFWGYFIRQKKEPCTASVM